MEKITTNRRERKIKNEIHDFCKINISTFVTQYFGATRNKTSREKEDRLTNKVAKYKNGLKLGLKIEF